jgi:hypothetical protein
LVASKSSTVQTTEAPLAVVTVNTVPLGRSGLAQPPAGKYEA